MEAWGLPDAELRIKHGVTSSTSSLFRNSVRNDHCREGLVRLPSPQMRGSRCWAGPIFSSRGVGHDPDALYLSSGVQGVRRPVMPRIPGRLVVRCQLGGVLSNCGNAAHRQRDCIVARGTNPTKPLRLLTRTRSLVKLGA